MYEPNVWVKTPSEIDIPISRYFKPERFFDLVESGRLHFARLDQFPDAFEGVLPDSTLALGKDGFSHEPINPGDERTDWESHIFSTNRAGKRLFFASCWYASNYESELMWRLYGENAVTVRSTFRRLCDCITDPESVHVGQVLYRNFHNDQPPTYGSLIVPPFLKQREYEQDQEVRAVVGRMPEDYTNQILEAPEPPDFWPTGIKISLDLRQLIDRVTVAPRTPKSVGEEIEHRLREHGLDVPVEPSVLDRRPRLV